MAPGSSTCSVRFSTASSPATTTTRSSTSKSASSTRWTSRSTRGSATPPGTLRCGVIGPLGRILIKDRGRYRGRQIVPAESIDLVLEGSKPAPQYGLGWWRNQAKTGPAPFYAGGLPDLAFAAGVGNQRLYVLPEQDLVVVRFGAVDRHWSDEEFLTRLLGDAAGAGD